MVYWLEGVLLYIASLLVHSSGVDPTCECVVYQSYGQSQGRFHSANYPTPYKPGINCVLFTFIGDINEIVEITFIGFDLRAPTQISPYQAQCDDWLRVFYNLDSPVVNENNVHDKELCGNISSLEDKTFYSRGRSLILEFHTDPRSRESHTGFKGRYKFLLKSTFVTQGDLRYGTQCTYFMQSRNNQTKGLFYSPHYPQKYPKSANCQYLFFGLENERVKLKFLNIVLPSQGSRHNRHSANRCEDSPDRIVVYDGKDANQPVRKVLCDVHNRVEIISTGPYMYVEFRSDQVHEKKGFAGEYEFINENVTPIPTYSENGSVRSTDVTDDTCNQIIYSRDGRKKGMIQSLNYPKSYPSSITCHYEFRGEGQERVQIKFKEMNLHYSGPDPLDPYDCDLQDSITVFVYSGEEEQELGVFCGKKIPPQLMSSTVRMKLVFRSISNGRQDEYLGFEFEYKFTTDFGVQGNGVQDDRKVCTFIYSSSKYLQGRFTSPNHLGQYPRDTVCQYIFYGNRNERVQIVFTKFDVDGILPRCDSETNSDTVSFSNYLNSNDRKMPKFCGKKPPSQAQVTSDGAFFNVMFKSNSIYDATGFVGEYQFISTEVPKNTLKPKPQKEEASSGSRSIAMSTTTVVIATCVLLCQTVILKVL